MCLIYLRMSLINFSIFETCGQHYSLIKILEATPVSNEKKKLPVFSKPIIHTISIHSELKLAQ